jgi:hypothetical protein
MATPSIGNTTLGLRLLKINNLSKNKFLKCKKFLWGKKICILEQKIYFRGHLIAFSDDTISNLPLRQ